MDASISEHITPRDIVTHRSGSAAPRPALVQLQLRHPRRHGEAARAPRAHRRPAREVPVQQPDVHDRGPPDRDAHRQELGAERARAAVRSARDDALDVLGARLAEGRRLRAALPRARRRSQARAHPVPAHRPGGPGRLGELVGQRDGEVAALQPAPRQGGRSPADPGGDARRDPLAADADPGQARASRHLGAVVRHGLGDRHLSRPPPPAARRRHRRLHHLGDVLSRRRSRRGDVHQRRFRSAEPARAARRRPHARARAGRLERRRAGAGEEGARGGEDRRREQGRGAPPGHPSLARDRRVSGRVRASRLRHAAHRGGRRARTFTPSSTTSRRRSSTGTTTSGAAPRRARAIRRSRTASSASRPTSRATSRRSRPSSTTSRVR